MEDRITSLSEADLVKLGERMRSAYLLEQASYTIPLARSEGEPLAKLMRPGLIDLTEKARASVAKSYEDKTVTAEEAKLATEYQHTTLHSITEWGRKASARATAAVLSGATLPAQMTYVPTARSIPARIKEVQGLLGLLEQHTAAMDQVGPPTQPLIDEGRKLCEAIVTSDGEQELKRGSTLPVAVANFYARKAELYIGLKIINQAGHELYAHDLASASRFNLSLLYRKKTGGPAQTSPTPPAPTPSTSTPSAAAP